MRDARIGEWAAARCAVARDRATLTALLCAPAASIVPGSAPLSIVPLNLAFNLTVTSDLIIPSAALGRRRAANDVHVAARSSGSGSSAVFLGPCNAAACTTVSLDTGSLVGLVVSSTGCLPAGCQLVGVVASQLDSPTGVALPNVASGYVSFQLFANGAVGSLASLPPASMALSLALTTPVSGAASCWMFNETASLWVPAGASVRSPAADGRARVAGADRRPVSAQTVSTLLASVSCTVTDPAAVYAAQASVSPSTVGASSSTTTYAVIAGVLGGLFALAVLVVVSVCVFHARALACSGGTGGPAKAGLRPRRRAMYRYRRSHIRKLFFTQAVKSVDDLFEVDELGNVLSRGNLSQPVTVGGSSSEAFTPGSIGEGEAISNPLFLSDEEALELRNPAYESAQQHVYSTANVRMPQWLPQPATLCPTDPANRRRRSRGRPTSRRASHES